MGCGNSALIAQLNCWVSSYAISHNVLPFSVTKSQPPSLQKSITYKTLYRFPENAEGSQDIDNLRKKHSRKCPLFQISFLRQLWFKRSLTHQPIFVNGKRNGLSRKIQTHGLDTLAFLRSKQRTNNQQITSSRPGDKIHLSLGDCFKKLILLQLQNISFCFVKQSSFCHFVTNVI